MTQTSANIPLLELEQEPNCVIRILLHLKFKNKLMKKQLLSTGSCSLDRQVVLKKNLRSRLNFTDKELVLISNKTPYLYKP